MALERFPDNSSIIDKNGLISLPWSPWFKNLWLLASTIGDHGTTAQRPATNLFIGRQYFDDTLGLPVYIKSVSAGVATWVKGDGSAA